MHPFVIGEIACGHLENREEVLSLLHALPGSSLASQEEVLHLISERKLYGKGLGWVDLHLLASALLSKSQLWTRDKPLGRAAGAVKNEMPSNRP